MNKDKKIFYNIIKNFLLIVLLGCIYIHKSHAEKSVVTGNNHSLIEKLDLLYKSKPTSVVKFNKINTIKLDKITTSKYLFLERKEGSNCSFPLYITLQHNNIKETFSGLQTSKNKKIIFTNNNENEKFFDTIFREQKNSSSCDELTIKIYNNDPIEIHKYMKKFDTYKVDLSSFELNKLHANMPTRKQRHKSEFKFQNAKGKIKFKENEYNIKIKPRGVTSSHWENKKKSYTVKANKISNPTKLFYIPERRAMLGEYLIQKTAKFMDLRAVNSTFGHLEINGINNGLYYIIDDFDKHFLITSNLPEANIYHTDSYKTASTYNVSDIKKNMFIGNIKKHKSKFDSDISYFMRTIKEDNTYLSDNWQNHFDKENLVKMLSLIQFSVLSFSIS